MEYLIEHLSSNAEAALKTIDDAIKMSAPNAGVSSEYTGKLSLVRVHLAIMCDALARAGPELLNIRRQRDYLEALSAENLSLRQNYFMELRKATRTSLSPELDVRSPSSHASVFDAPPRPPSVPAVSKPTAPLIGDPKALNETNATRVDNIKKVTQTASEQSQPRNIIQTHPAASPRDLSAPPPSSAMELSKQKENERRKPELLKRKRELDHEPLIGMEIVKSFGKLGRFKGRVKAYYTPYYKILYEDGDEEDLTEQEVLKHIA